MSVREKVLHLLEESRCGFKLIGHPRTISAQEAAKVAGSKVEEVAKSLISDFKLKGIKLILIPEFCLILLRLSFLCFI